jgi:hypothetical protein
VSRCVLLIMLTAGLLLSTSAAGFANPAANLRVPQMAVHTSNVTPVYYVWNHHHYDHRRWDATHKRWNYY